jgi:MacB-like periplasmic core domain
VHVGSATDTRAGGHLYYAYVQANYFKTLGIPLLAGRGFEVSGGGAESTMLVSESAARELWPGQKTVGRSLDLRTDRYPQFHDKGELLPDGTSCQVIGVVRDVRGVEMDGGDSKRIYVALPDERVDGYPMLIRINEDAGQFMNE